MVQTKEEKAAYHKAYYEANKEKVAAYKKAHYEANKEAALAKSRAYYEANKEAELAYNKAYREANREKVLAYKKAHYEANKEEILAKNKAYKKAYRESNREEVLAKSKAYREANREKVLASKARRRALKRKQIPVHLRNCPKEKERLVQTYRLRNILSQATGVEHHVDHMWPLADGGPHWSGNLQVIPAEENLRKNASVCEDTKGTIIKSLYTFESERPI